MTFREEFDAMPPHCQRVAVLIPTGMSNKEIAKLTGTTWHVVRNYLKDVYVALGVSDRLELAVRIARECPELIGRVQ